MLRICYTSRAHRRDDSSLLPAIIASSDALNRRDHVTGLLLFVGRCFLQALEGSDAAVTACFDRITRDPRHSDIRVIFDTVIGRREFGRWSMRRRLLRSADGAGHREAFRQQVMQDVAEVTDMDLRAFFVGFAMIGESLAE